MKTLIFYVLLIYCSVLSAVDVYSSGFVVQGQGKVFNSFVKSGHLPAGRQYTGAFSGGAGISLEKTSFLLFCGYHKTLYSVPVGLLLYRNYRGYELGINIRREVGEMKKFDASWGMGFLLSGNYDKYVEVKQYMVFPTIGAEIFMRFKPFAKNLFHFDIGLPLVYAFRESGHYFNTGISIQISICLQQSKH